MLFRKDKIKMSKSEEKGVKGKYSKKVILQNNALSQY